LKYRFYRTPKEVLMQNILNTTGSLKGGGFLGGLLLGYAPKKVVKLIVVIVGLFITGFGYLQYHQ
jgi:uncharacterized membrane protein (Fun14 family)